MVCNSVLLGIHTCIPQFSCMFAGLSDALIEALSDRDGAVRKAASASLIEIGRHQLDICLKAGLDFLTKHPRVQFNLSNLTLNELEKMLN